MGTLFAQLLMDFSPDNFTGKFYQGLRIVCGFGLIFRLIFATFSVFYFFLSWNSVNYSAGGNYILGEFA